MEALSSTITLEQRADDGHAPARRPLCLHVAVAPGPPHAGPVSLGTEVVQIGREVGPGGLQLADPSVSRVHARIELDRAIDEHVLSDLGSRNGVFVNGARARSQLLRAGDVVRLGESVLVVAHVAPPDEDDAVEGLLGRGAAMTALRAAVRRVAPSALPVLVTGPTGTGKDVVARAIHALSGRAGRSVAINCAALPVAMAENALFGHKKGAYTDATRDEDGAFVLADGGTLFLDEIGDLPLDLQPKLLRALENGEVTPLGTAHAVRVDARVVAATHAPLATAIAERRFREDLYARLAGVILQAPPLAQRREDLLLLFRSFLPAGVRDRPASADFVEALLVHEWPRNVRELRLLAERLAVLAADAPRWELAHLDDVLAEPIRRRAAAASPPPAEPGPPSRDELLALLAAHGGRVADVAREMRRNRKQVYRWMDQHGIARGEGRKR